MTEQKFLLEPGNYVLTENVTNPKCDRRMTRDWREMAVYDAGMKFTVEERIETYRGMVDGDVGEIEHKYRVIHLYGSSGYKSMSVRNGPENADDLEGMRVWMLSQKLKKLEDNALGDLFTGSDSLGTHLTIDILALMIEQGLVTLPQVRATAKTLNDLDEDKWHELRKKHRLHNL